MAVRFSGEGTWLNTRALQVTSQPRAYRFEFLEVAMASLGDPLAVSQGHYLCEGCWDQMTDEVLPADQSPTGLDMGYCHACQEARR